MYTYIYIYIYIYILYIYIYVYAYGVQRPRQPRAAGDRPHAAARRGAAGPHQRGAGGQLSAVTCQSIHRRDFRGPLFRAPLIISLYIFI